MNKILKIEMLSCLALSLLIVLAGIIGISTFNYIEVLKIVEILLILIVSILLLIIRDNKTKINVIDLICVGIFLILLLLIILRGYFSPALNIEYYFDAPAKRIMYFNYYSYVIMFPLTILVGYSTTLYVNFKKKQN